MATAKNTVPVLAGQKKIRVGLIPLAVGMLTSVGTITRITDSGTVFIRATPEEKERRIHNLDQMSVRLTEARKFGYPESKGCRKYKDVTIKRGEQTITV